MKDYLQTVTGPVAREDMGLTLPHEHLFNDLSSVVDAPCYPFSQRLVDKKVTAEIQWALKHDPYCCADNMDRKPIEDVIFEINNFISLGGRTIVDATGSESIGRDAQALREVALKTGLNIVASSGPYLEKFESQRIHKTVDELAATIDKELNQGIGDTDIRAGMIGEIGVSPTFTEAEHNSLRAASLAQINNPHVAMNIHMPGWLRRGDEVLDIVLGEMGVSPNKVSLAHSDPSGKDVAYQRKMLDKGVWLEFDMIGLDITFPKEGIAPGVQETAFNELRHHVVIVGVKPFGHFRCRRRFASRCTSTTNTEQGVDIYRTIFVLMTWRNITQQQTGGQYMIVPGKIAHRQQVDTRLLLLIPVTSTQFTPYRQQFFTRGVPRPITLLRFFQLATQANARETEGVIKNCHYMPLMEFLVFSRPDVYTSIIGGYCIFLKRKLFMSK